jgi:hypothetical protein
LYILKRNSQSDEDKFFLSLAFGCCEYELGYRPLKNLTKNTKKSYFDDKNKKEKGSEQ